MADRISSAAKPDLVGETRGQEEGPAAGTAGPKAAFQVQIYRDWCKACGICAALCPKQVLGRDEAGRPVVVNPEACSGCGWCEIHCPDFAISVAAKAPEGAEEEYA